MISQHLPALVIAMPMLAAPFCVVLHGARLAWLLSVVVSAATFAACAGVLAQVLANGTVVYLLGSWVAPFGIEYRIDALNALVALVVSGISTFVLIGARQSVESEVANERIYLFYTCWMLCLTGLLGMTITGDAFNVFVFLEISSLSTYVLISLSRDPRGLTAAFRYLILGTVGATFLLIGIGLLYQLTGSLNMADIGERLAAAKGSRTVAVAFVFVVVGIGLKVAMFPLHAWLPGAYAHAPSLATAFLAGTATKVSIYLLIRFTVGVFGIDVAYGTFALGEVLLVLGALGVLVPSAIAVFQNDLKLLFAYSSIGQIGYMVLGIGIGSAVGLTASIVHLFNHALIKTGLFMAIAGIILHVGSAKISDLNGLAKRMPMTAASIVLGGLSLIGVPLTSGFISKWYLITAAVAIDAWIIVAVILVGSLLAVAYIWKLVEAAYFLPVPEGMAMPGGAQDGALGMRREAPLSLLVPTWGLLVANVYFGVHTDLTVGVAQRAAAALGVAG